MTAVWTRLSRWIRQPRLDLLFAAILTGVALVEIWFPDYAPGVEATPGPKLLLTTTGVMATAPVAVRRPAPVVALTLVLGGIAAQTRFATPVQGLAELVAMLLCAFAVGRYC